MKRNDLVSCAVFAMHQTGYNTNETRVELPQTDTNTTALTHGGVA